VLIDEIALGQRIEDVDFSADGKTAFATPFEGNLVKVVNADTRQVTGAIDIGFVAESQIERRPNSANLYVDPCDTRRRELLIINGDTASAIDLDPNTPGIQGIAVPSLVPPGKWVSRRMAVSLMQRRAGLLGKSPRSI
jgi:DNA-binding beta-propeller fold protein YncE